MIRTLAWCLSLPVQVTSAAIALLTASVGLRGLTWAVPMSLSVYTYGRIHQQGVLGLCLSLPTEAVVVALPRFCVNTELHGFHWEG